MNTTAPPPHPTETPVSHAYDDFLDEIAALGLLENLEDALPAGFSAVYEIGRILADPKSNLGARIAPLMSLAPALAAPTSTAHLDPEASLIEVTAGEEYEAEFIRTWSDVRHIYQWQHLLPEEEFLRRWAERRLWFPMAKSPQIQAIESGEDDFAPSPSKQRVYVLLDTSKSMALRHRFALAKAAVLRFLRQNRSELGEVTVRTFDVDVGPAMRASDKTSYDRVLGRVTRQDWLGNGTCLERAILQACEDIHEQRSLAGAEILIVTDGAARLEEGKVARALGDRIRLHCLKIGGAQVYATDQYVRDTLEYHRGTDTRREQRIVQLRKRRKKLQQALRDTRAPDMREEIERFLRRIESEQKVIAEELRKDYGHEIERLAHLYIEIPDLDPDEVFALDDAQLEALKRLTQRILAELDASPAPPEAMKQAALLMSHLTLLESQQLDPVAREFLQGLRRSIESRMEAAMQSHEEHLLDGGLLSPADQRDLRVLLHGGAARGSPLWLMLLRYFARTVARVLRRGH